MASDLNVLAIGLINEMKISADGSEPRVAQTLYESHGNEIKSWLASSKSSAELGVIAASGLGLEGSGMRTSLYHVHCGTYLDKRLCGHELLIEIACTAVIAEMADVFRAREAASVLAEQ